eukprot:4515366-Prymnesium_polylepis.1
MVLACVDSKDHHAQIALTVWHLMPDNVLTRTVCDGPKRRDVVILLREGHMLPGRGIGACPNHHLTGPRARLGTPILEPQVGHRRHRIARVQRAVALEQSFDLGASLFF